MEVEAPEASVASWLEAGVDEDWDDVSAWPLSYKRSSVEPMCSATPCAPRLRLTARPSGEGNTSSSDMAAALALCACVCVWCQTSRLSPV